MLSQTDVTDLTLKIEQKGQFLITQFGLLDMNLPFGEGNYEHIQWLIHRPIVFNASFLHKSLMENKWNMCLPLSLLHIDHLRDMCHLWSNMWRLYLYSFDIYYFVMIKHFKLKTEKLRLAITCSPDILHDLPYYRWVTQNSEHTPENPCFFCDQCFRALHYDENGDKLGSFEAYRFFDCSAVIWDWWQVRQLRGLQILWL